MAHAEKTKGSDHAQNNARLLYYRPGFIAFVQFKGLVAGPWSEWR